ncbi:MAG TPA: YceI family protein, partial [Acidimicrobiales bacterium]|nr:YceI family protein [Acidimicrobiales bacterium]
MKVHTDLDTGEWTLDTAATSIGFRAKAIFGMKVKGRFERYESTIMVGASAAESAISTIVWTDSVETGI